MGSSFRDQFNTPLTPAEKVAFDSWTMAESAKRGRDLTRDSNDYDLQGYWKDVASREGSKAPVFEISQPGHMTDTYKKPNHPTFSDESKYHGSPAPWGKYEGGKWTDTTYTPSTSMLEHTHNLADMKKYFEESEPGVSVVSPGKSRNRWASLLGNPQEEDMASPSEVQGRTEALGNGLALGWGPRLGAAVQAGAAGLSGGDAGKTYNQALGENRDILKREQAAEPWRAGALTAVGAVPSTIATSGKGAAGTAAADLGVAATLPGAAIPLMTGVGRAAVGGFTPGAFAGLGSSDSAGVGQLVDGLKGGAMGALGGAALRGAGNAALRVPAIKTVLAQLQRLYIQRKIGPIGEIPEPGDFPPEATRQYLALGKLQNSPQFNRAAGTVGARGSDTVIRPPPSPPSLSERNTQLPSVAEILKLMGEE